MIELFKMGGPLFMGILTILLIGVIVMTVRYLTSPDKTVDGLNLIKSIGLFAMITGILGQLIGLFQAFGFIEQMGSVSPAILVSGLKVSMITTLYGILIYLISYSIWLVLKLKK